MKIIKDINDPTVAEVLLNSGLVVALTDTIYGVLAVASDEMAVNKVYSVKHRSQDKSPIVLIASINQMFDSLPDSHNKVTDDNWPDKTSIIFPSTESPVWLRRDNHSVAYRIPKVNALRQLIEITGPLIAPSANPEGQPPAMTVEVAMDYFGDGIDVYVDSGEASNDRPSQLLRALDDGQFERRLR